MADKSPHDAHAAKKSGKALKEKRAARRQKQEAHTAVENLLHPHPAPRS